MLSWTAPAAVGAGIAGYNVYRGATKANATVIPAATTTYTDTAAPANSTLSYTVKAVETGTNVESAASAAFAVVYDTTTPTAPTGVTGDHADGAAPVLTWNARHRRALGRALVPGAARHDAARHHHRADLHRHRRHDGGLVRATP